MGKVIIFSLLLFAIFATSCNNSKANTDINKMDSAHSCMNVPNRFGNNADANALQFSGDTSVADIVLIPGGIFDMGGDIKQAGANEYPKHKVQVTTFYIDVTEVTNAQFKLFVDAKGYKTTAEKNLIGKS